MLDDMFPLMHRRREIILGALTFADLLPPGDDQNYLRDVADSLTFFAECVPHQERNFVGKPSNSPVDERPSIVRGPENVFNIHMPLAVFGKIRQWAEAERLPLSHAIQWWVSNAIKNQRVELH
jgi:hypothetical protein